MLNCKFTENVFANFTLKYIPDKEIKKLNRAFMIKNNELKRDNAALDKYWFDP